jgi:hypothetical protein
VANATFATSAASATTAGTANSVAGANVSGTVANATFATSAGSATTATTAATANSVAGANVTGTVANATFATSAASATSATTAGTVTTAAQSNITSVGILTSMSSTGNVTANYFLGNGSQLTGLPATYGNANVAANLAAFGTNPISTSGNITAGYFVGDGSQLTGLPAGYANANATSLLASFGSNTISTTGNITSGNLNVGVDAVIAGNLTVNGTTTTVNSNTVTINDKFINVANNASTAAAANGGGLGVGPIGGEYASLTYNSTANAWNTSIPVSVNGNVTASYVIGDGSALSSLSGGNVTGAVANATYATSAGSATTATTAGTVTSNAQANITSVGVLSSLSVTGNISTSANFVGNGAALTGIVSSYGNANVAANLAAFGTNPISTTGNVTAGYFVGNGSLLSNIAAANVTGNVANANAAVFLKSSTNSAVNMSIDATFGQINLPGGAIINYSGDGDPNTIGSINLIGAQANLANTYAQLTFVNQANFVANPLNAMRVSNVGPFMFYDGLGAFGGAKTVSLNGGGFSTNTLFSAAGNITGANILTGGLVSATGNVTGNYFLGNGSQLSNVAANSAVFLRASTNAAATMSIDDTTKLMPLPGGGFISYAGYDGPTFGSIDITAPQANIANSYVAFSHYTAANTAATPVNVCQVDINGVLITYDAYGAGKYYRFENSGLNIQNAGISATGNITGGNIITAGAVSTTGRVIGVNYTEKVNAIGSSGGTISPNISLGSIQSVTLTSNLTFNSITNIVAGQSFTFVVTQDGTGSRTLTSTMLYAGGNKTLSTAAGAVDIISVFYNGTTYYASLTKGYS